MDHIFLLHEGMCSGVTLGCKSVQKCVRVSLLVHLCGAGIKKTDAYMIKSLKRCTWIYFSSCTHTVTDGEVIFNQTVSMCLGLNGLLQVNLDPY